MAVTATWSLPYRETGKRCRKTGTNAKNGKKMKKHVRPGDGDGIIITSPNEASRTERGKPSDTGNTKRSTEQQRFPPVSNSFPKTRKKARFLNATKPNLHSKPDGATERPPYTTEACRTFLGETRKPEEGRREQRSAEDASRLDTDGTLANLGNDEGGHNGHPDRFYVLLQGYRLFRACYRCSWLRMEPNPPFCCSRLKGTC